MEAEEFYKQRNNSIRELWALSPKQIEYTALIMEEYAALRQPPVSGSYATTKVRNRDGTTIGKIDPFMMSHLNLQACV